MPILTLEHVSHAYGYLPLLEDANLRVDAGERLALIGRNGTGKSTLLSIVAGDLLPDAGSVWRAPGTRVARLVQDVPLESNRTVRDEVGLGLLDTAGRASQLRQGSGVQARSTPGDADSRNRPGDEDAYKIDVILSRLELPAARRVSDLSGGWRRRVLLGRALVAEPDLLLLDEPTNHLDIEAIQWLERYVAGFNGALLFVTHDRAFLRRLATRIIELDRGRLTSWPGSYDVYLERKAAALDVEARDLERLDKKLAEEEAWLRRGIKARRTRNEGRVKALVELRADRASRRMVSGQVRMTLDRGDAGGRLVFESDEVSFAYDGTPVVAGFSSRILRGDRIGLIGPNGSGKTTLLRLLTGELTATSGEVRRGGRVTVAYFDQQRQQLDPERTVAESVVDGDTVTINGQPRHVLGYLADFLFPRERARSPVKALSGGERNRLLLARLFAQPANVLVLDEPTNDLDIETLELLEELLDEFDGTVLLVTHDREFLDNLVTSTFAFEGEGRIVEYVGGWQDYVRQSNDRRALNEENGRLGQRRVPLDPPEMAGPPPRRKKTFKEEREYAALPARIEGLEDEQRRLQSEAGGVEFYKSPTLHIQTVLARIDAVHADLEVALARWVELEEIGR